MTSRNTSGVVLTQHVAWVCFEGVDVVTVVEVVTVGEEGMEHLQVSYRAAVTKEMKHHIFTFEHYFIS